MNSDIDVFGVKAKVYIDFDESLEKLGSIIEKALNLKALRYENNEDEPYDLIGYTEVLGFELVLRSVINGFHESQYLFVLVIFTTDCFKEIFNDRIYDTSLWLARYLSMICELKTIAEITNGESKKIVKFWHDKPNRMNEVIEMQL